MRNLDNWIAKYLQFTENSEPPKIYRLWTAISTISTVMQRKCWLHWGHDNIYPNFYIVLVGPPGGRKGTAIAPARKMIQTIQPPVPMASDCVTRAQLVREIAESKDNFKYDSEIFEHRSLAIWSSEFSVFIGEKNPDMVITLTDLFDNPDRWKYSTKGSGKDVADSCYLTLLGAITPSILQSKLTQEAVGGGLVSRIIFAVAYGPEKLVPQPWNTQEDETLSQELEVDLAKIRVMAGPFRFTERAMEEYTQWYMNPESSQAVDADQFTGYNARRALHLRKLCMILSAAERDDRTITLDNFKQALAVLQFTEREMPNAFFGLGRGNHAQTMADVLLKFQQKQTMSWQELVDRFKMDSNFTSLGDLMTMLEISGRVKSETSNTGKVRYHYIPKEEKTHDDSYLNETIFKYTKPEGIL